MPIQLELAQKLLLDAAKVADTEILGLEDCWRRILAQPVIASIDYPPFDRTPLDGYAIIAAEAEDATAFCPVVLHQISNIPAGGYTEKKITAGTACRIMTGAPLPEGATGIVRQEDTAITGDKVKIYNGKGAGQNICRKGEEIVKGEEVLSFGSVINTGVMGILALLGVHRPLVYKKPRIGLLATGSELISIDGQLTYGKIRDSNSYMLAAQVKEAGAEPVFLGRASDDIDEICCRIAKAEGCDMIVTTGGASVGDYDLMGKVFARLGVALFFEKISMKPGMPVLAGYKDNRLLVGLSGNPAAASISFEQLVRPVILKMGGRKEVWRPILRARLTKELDKRVGPKRFVWAIYWQGRDSIMVEPLFYQGNGMLKSAIQANGLIIIPENSGPMAAGSDVEVMDIGSP